MSGPARPVAAIVIGRGGWSVYVPAGTGVLEGETTCSGYGADWLEYLHGRRAGYVVPDECPVVDLTACSADDLPRFAIAGPMVGPGVPAGMVSKLGAGLVPFDPAPDPRRGIEYSRLGNARALDTVAPDVYCTLATRHGAIVATAGEHRAALARVAALVPADDAGTVAP